MRGFLWTTRSVEGDVKGTVVSRIARRMWLLTEPIHVVVYFAPEHRRAQDAAGVRGGWMAYFASRSAPLGPVPAEVVTATFYNFAPAMVARAIPDAWRFSTPQRVLEARYRGVGAALDRILGSAVGRSTLEEAVTLLRAAVAGCDPAGRPLFAANLALDWPDEPAVALWHATTLLREYRGDGHVTALAAHEIGGCEALVLAAANGRTTADMLRSRRGWTEQEWREAIGRLADRGLSTTAGALTDEGRRLHDAVEDLTDRLAAAPWDRLGGDGVRRLGALLSPVLAAVDAAEAVPYPNPVGLPAPSSRTGDSTGSSDPP